MKYTTLGNTGIEVSRICVGCMSYGKASEDFHPWTLGPEDTQAMVGHAIDLGVNFFDTANIYSFGTSEEYLGRALRNIGVPRDKVVIASKVFFNEGQLSPKPFSARLTERSGASEPIIWTFTRFTALIMVRPSRKRWKPLTRW